MKYLIIVVEGQTEQEFVNDILRPYFAEHGIYHVSARLIRTSRSGKGGFVNFQHLLNDVNKILTKEQDAVVTTFFDFFRCPTNMPGYEEAMKKENHQEAVEILETKMDEFLEILTLCLISNCMNLKRCCFHRIKGLRHIGRMNR